MGSSRVKKFSQEFLLFGLKQARACIFAGSFFVILFLSTKIQIPEIPRYDFILLAAILLQIILVATKLETLDELKAISMFHLIGLILEIFKTHPSIGSWSYPEFSYFKIFNVPLYSGFMYAAVASYMAQAWRILNIRLHKYPSYKLSLPLAAAVYLNFFTHHFLPDFRWILIALILITFWKTKVLYRPLKRDRNMPLALSFLLTGFFIWIAENIATYFKAWNYPNQNDGWHLVNIGKISSWSLLIIMSFIIIANLKHYKTKTTATADELIDKNLPD